MSTGNPSGWAWSDVDVRVPPPSALPPGISMAGFRQRAPARCEIAMVAHPSVTLLVELSGQPISYDTPGRHQRGSSTVIGLLPGELRVSGQGTGECLQIRLEPAKAATVLGAPGELSGMVVPLEALWGRHAQTVEERLRTAASWEERFAIAAGILARRLDSRPPVDPEVEYTWRRMLASRGRLRVDRAADEVGWSRKRMWSRFRSQLGVTPKRAAQVVRFDHAAHLLAAGDTPARVASESGYADQSHLHREVRAFAGMTPADLAGAPWLAIDGAA